MSWHRFDAQRILDTLPVGALILDPRGVIAGSNAEATAMLGMPAEELAGTDLTNLPWLFVDRNGTPMPFVPFPGYVARYCPVRPVGMIAGIRCDSGPIRWFHVNARPLAEPGGEPPFWAVVSLTDVSDAMERRSRLLDAALRFAIVPNLNDLLQELVDVSVQAFGGELGGVAFWNETYQTLTAVVGYLPEHRHPLMAPLSLKGTASGLAVEQRRPVIVHDYWRWAHPSTPALANHPQTMMAAPLIYEGKVLGALSVGTTDRTRKLTEFDAHDLGIVASLGAASMIGHELMAIQSEQPKPVMPSADAISPN